MILKSLILWKEIHFICNSIYIWMEEKEKEKENEKSYSHPALLLFLAERFEWQ